MFSRNIFKRYAQTCSKSETSAHAPLVITLLYILLPNILTWLHSGHEWGHVTFRRISYYFCNFLVEMSTFKQAIKLTFGRNKFGKRTMQNLQTRIHF